jgi:hypothetical protein
MMCSKKYLFEFGSAMVAYVLVVIASVSHLRANPETEFRVIVGFAPAVPIAFIVWAILRELNRMDEMQRRIQTDAMAASFGAGTLFLVTGGFLENAGIGQVDPSWVGTGMLILWGIISTVQRFRYRGGVE